MKVLALLILTVIWHLASLLIAKPFLPTPIDAVIRTAEEFLHGRLLVHTAISAERIIFAIGAASLLAVPAALAAGRNRRAHALISPAAGALYPIPKVALLPVIMLFFGLNDLSKVIFITIVITFQLFFVVRDAAHAIDERYIDSIRSLGAGRFEILRHVIIPAILPNLFTALRISTGTAAAVLFLAETFASVTGLGWYIMDGWIRLDYLDMYAGIISLSLLGSLLFGLFALLERRLCSWNHRP